MKIDLYIVDKKGKSPLYTPLTEHYIKSCKQFAKVEVHDIFDKNISKAQEISPSKAQESYTKALEGFLPGGYNIALHPEGREMSSEEFARLFKDKVSIRLFIGGAYGFEEGFIRQCNKSVSFGKITLSHRLAKLVAMEQIFRALTILNDHPYHK